MHAQSIECLSCRLGVSNISLLVECSNWNAFLSVVAHKGAGVVRFVSGVGVGVACTWINESIEICCCLGCLACSNYVSASRPRYASFFVTALVITFNVGIMADLYYLFSLPLSLSLVQ